MTEPTAGVSPARPVPGPPRPGPRPGATAAVGEPATPRAADGDAQPDDPFADLAGRPVAEHAAIFEAAHARLERELGTIDRL